MGDQKSEGLLLRIIHVWIALVFVSSTVILDITIIVNVEFLERVH